MNKNNLNISIFCGGSGCSGFIKYLSKFQDVNINLIVNGYDYGKSSGKIRDIIPNMLAPSDFRKNISLLINENNLLKEIFDYRLLNKSDYNNLINVEHIDQKNSKLSNLILNLPFQKFNEFTKYIKIFDDFIKNNKLVHDKDNFFLDFSIGNILFAGFFIKYKDFNITLEKISAFAEIEHKVINVTNGDNLYLYALNSIGKLSNEVEIIENSSLEKITDIFLLKKNLNEEEINKIEILKEEEKIKYLNNLQVLPKLNNSLESVLKNSDLVIFGPGTQHSSLFPSYLTNGLNEIISKIKCDKIMLTNIYFDNDLFYENSLTLIKKFYYYLSNKQNIIDKDIIDFIFLNKYDEDNINLIDTDKYFPSEIYNDSKVKILDFEGESGKHLPQLVFDEISKRSRRNFELKDNQNTYFLVSIVVPCLNEERTVETVLENLSKLDFKNIGLDKEVIVVDGGSTDKSIEICKKFKNIKFYTLSNKGRGEVINYGIKKSKGDIIVTYPSDNEFLVSDISKLVNQLFLNEVSVVYGSRMIKYNQKKYLKKIYKNNYFLYWISNMGGLAIRLFILLFYNKYIADPFTSLKAFKSSVIKKIDNRYKGVDYDINQIIELVKNKIYINEIEVSYFARSYEEGKKTNIAQGIKSLIVIFSSLFLKNKNNSQVNENR